MIPKKLIKESKMIGGYETEISKRQFNLAMFNIHGNILSGIDCRVQELQYDPYSVDFSVLSGVDCSVQKIQYDTYNVDFSVLFNIEEFTDNYSDIKISDIEICYGWSYLGDTLNHYSSVDSTVIIDNDIDRVIQYEGIKFMDIIDDKIIIGSLNESKIYCYVCNGNTMGLKTTEKIFKEIYSKTVDNENIHVRKKETDVVDKESDNMEEERNFEIRKKEILNTLSQMRKSILLGNNHILDSTPILDDVDFTILFDTKVIKDGSNYEFNYSNIEINDKMAPIIRVGINYGNIWMYSNNDFINLMENDDRKFMMITNGKFIIGSIGSRELVYYINTKDSSDRVLNETVFINLHTALTGGINKSNPLEGQVIEESKENHKEPVVEKVEENKDEPKSIEEVKELCGEIVYRTLEADAYTNKVPNAKLVRRLKHIRTVAALCVYMTKKINNKIENKDKLINVDTMYLAGLMHDLCKFECNDMHDILGAVRTKDILTDFGYPEIGTELCYIIKEHSNKVKSNKRIDLRQQILKEADIISHLALTYFDGITDIDSKCDEVDKIINEVTKLKPLIKTNVGLKLYKKMMKNIKFYSKELVELTLY